jgi:hypothetical protein
MSMDEPGYLSEFHHYERLRADYARLQDSIREFLLRFTGDPELHEKPFVIRDLAHMEGLRRQRDEAYGLYRQAEESIFERLGRQWAGSSEEPDSN